MIFTIGHSNHELDVFLELLRTHDIEVVADVRTRPYSKYSRHFSKEPIERALKEAGFNYVYLGQQLGGKPPAPRADFDAGLKRLREGAAKFRVVIMCAEENPERCHRRHLVSAALLAAGEEVRHIRRDGALQMEEDLEDPQGSLFD